MSYTNRFAVKRALTAAAKQSDAEYMAKFRHIKQEIFTTKSSENYNALVRAAIDACPDSAIEALQEDLCDCIRKARSFPVDFFLEFAKRGVTTEKHVAEALALKDKELVRIFCLIDCTSVNYDAPVIKQALQRLPKSFVNWFNSVRDEACEALKCHFYS